MTKSFQYCLISLLLSVLASGHTGSAGNVVRRLSGIREGVIAVESNGTLTVVTSPFLQPDLSSAIRHSDPVAPYGNHSLTARRRSIRQHASILGFIPHAHFQLAASLGTLMWDILLLDADDHMNLGEQALTLEKENWDKKAHKEDTSRILFLLLGLPIAYVVTVFVIAAIYKSRVTDNRRLFPNPVPFGWSLENNDFKFGLCDCTDDRDYCLTAWCCPLCRDADTYAAVGAAGFWSVFLMACALQVIAVVGFNLLGHATKSPDIQSLGLPIGLIVESCYFGCMRQQLRIALGGNGTECCMDCLCYHFFSCCIIAQNARHVDLASGAHVAFCCNLTYAPDESSIPIVVGVPVPVPSPNAASLMPPATN